MGMLRRKVLVTGGSGQLGSCLNVSSPDNADVSVYSSSKFDLSDKQQMRAVLEEQRPSVVVNCAAYTNVDGAESDREQAFLINHEGASDLALLCKELGVKLIHISTDFVFDGAGTLPYGPSDPTSPLGVYGQSKFAGEEALREGYPEGVMIIRTSWLYSEYGSNFVKTMIRLFGSKDSFSVVDDQVGSPTYALGLANLIWCIVVSDDFVPGTYHWSDSGQTTWFDFARKIGEEIQERQLVEKPGMVEPIPSEEYGSKTPRPSFSVLDCSEIQSIYPGAEQVSWQANLSEMLDRYELESE